MSISINCGKYNSVLNQHQKLVGCVIPKMLIRNVVDELVLRLLGEKSTLLIIAYIRSTH